MAEQDSGELKIMGLKEEFRRLLRENGRIVYLAVRGRGVCSCYRQPVKESLQPCPVCLGTGNPVSIHRVMTYSVNSPLRPSQPTSFQMFDPGEHSSDARVYYLETEPKIRSGDLLIEPIRQGSKFLGIDELYKLSFPYLYRAEDAGQRSREIYIRVGGIQLPSQKDLVEKAIRERFRRGG